MLRTVGYWTDEWGIFVFLQKFLVFFNNFCFILKELKAVLTGESLEPDYADFLHVEDDDSDHSKVSTGMVPVGTVLQAPGTVYMYCRGTGTVTGGC
jgi:hypothetical protein